MYNNVNISLSELEIPCVAHISVTFLVRMSGSATLKSPEPRTVTMLLKNMYLEAPQKPSLAQVEQLNLKMVLCTLCSSQQ